MMFLCAASTQARRWWLGSTTRHPRWTMSPMGKPCRSFKSWLSSECNWQHYPDFHFSRSAAHAFKPKDFTPRAYSASNTSFESPEEIKAKINRLSQTLSNTVNCPGNMRRSVSFLPIYNIVCWEESIVADAGVEAAWPWGEAEEADTWSGREADGDWVLSRVVDDVQRGAWSDLLGRSEPITLILK